MNTASTASVLRYQALLCLLRTAETLWNASRALFRRWDLGPSQFNILNLLFEAPAGLTQVELSRRLLMHRSNVTGLVDRLGRRKLVERREAPGDRRAHRVVLTPAGRRLVAEIRPRYFQAADEVWGGLSPRQARQLLAELTRVGANAERMAAELNSRHGSKPS